MLSAVQLYAQLAAAYGQPRWWSEDPYEVMVQAVLVQNTTWSSVEKTYAQSAGQLTPEAVEKLPIDTLEQLIRPCGFYKAKARTIKALTEWFGQYHYDRALMQAIPLASLRQELLALRGIGEETADVILVYAFYRPSFIIDAYTRRFLARLGYELANDKAIRRFFASGLPQDAKLYGYYHWLILTHSISTCRKLPKCEQCQLQKHCRQYTMAAP